MYQTIRQGVKWQVDKEIDKMRVNVKKVTQVGQREMLVEVEDGNNREIKVVELHSEKVIGEIVKEKRFTVE